MTATHQSLGPDRNDRSALARLLDRVWLAVDDRRIREHLRRVESALRRTDHDHLTDEQQRRRERTLDRLREYRRRGAFPRNGEAPARTPCFVGADGTPCAVAHLLRADGHGDLVERIAARENTIRLEDVEDGPIVDWLDETGLTREEAARIQPTYAESVHLATTCGPVPCWVAGALAAVVGLATFALAEYVGYRVVDDLFPDNALKRRGALGYLTVLNLLLVPLVAALVYALFP